MEQLGDAAFLLSLIRKFYGQQEISLPVVGQKKVLPIPFDSKATFVKFDTKNLMELDHD